MKIMLCKWSVSDTASLTYGQSNDIIRFISPIGPHRTTGWFHVKSPFIIDPEDRVMYGEDYVL